MLKKKVTPTQQQGKSDAFNTSISDLMAGMLAVFILALCYFMINFREATEVHKKAIEKVTDRNKTRVILLTNMENAINRAIDENKLQIDHINADTNRGILPLPAGIFFESGKAEIKGEGKVIIRVLGQSLSEALEKKEFADTVETIFIEGHTDDVQIGNNSKFDTNWQLSTERAIQTWEELKTAYPELEKKENKNIVDGKGQPYFSCSGYAETRPRPGARVDVVKDSEEERARKRAINRRIDIRITMLPPTKEELKDKGKRDK